MPNFGVTGIARETGRRRTRRYKAIDEAQAREFGEKDGISVSDITLLPPDPPTERQTAYAADLGIAIPDGASYEEVSNLIDQRLASNLGIVIPAGASKEEINDLINARRSEDNPASSCDQNFARRHGVAFTQFTGERVLFERIFSRLREPGREADMTAWFVFRVYRELVVERNEAKINDPDDPIIIQIAAELAKDEAVTKSIRRYQGEDLIWFGEWTSPDGTWNVGASNNTIAYKQASVMLRKRFGDDLRALPRKNHQISSPTVSHRAGNSGCLPVVVGLIVVLFFSL